MLNAHEVAGLCISFRVRCELHVRVAVAALHILFRRSRCNQCSLCSLHKRRSRCSPRRRHTCKSTSLQRRGRRAEYSGCGQGEGGWDSPVWAVPGSCISRNIHRSFADMLKVNVQTACATRMLLFPFVTSLRVKVEFL